MEKKGGISCSSYIQLKLDNYCIRTTKLFFHHCQILIRYFLDCVFSSSNLETNRPQYFFCFALETVQCGSNILGFTLHLFSDVNNFFGKHYWNYMSFSMVKTLVTPKSPIINEHKVFSFLRCFSLLLVPLPLWLFRPKSM